MTTSVRTAQRSIPNRHRFHALCPYFAMFPETFVETWIKRLTKPSDVILDPFCGRGTTPFQALLMGRGAIGSDINPVAYCVTRAKTCAPSKAALLRRLTVLERDFDPDEVDLERRNLPEFFRFAYRAPTLRQILYLRNRLDYRRSDSDCMLAALVLGSLHGESARSPMYLSNQMPHTISTKPAYSVRFWKARKLVAPARDTFALLRQMVAYRYESSVPVRRATVMQLDMRELPRESKRFPSAIRHVITSPPYFDVTSYEEDQWLRLWFLGHEPNPTYDRISRDDRHERADDYWGLIADMWRCLGLVLADRAEIVVRLGATRIEPRGLLEALEGTSSLSGRRVRLATHEVSEISRRQTDAFRPGSQGCKVEVDCHFKMA